MKIDEFRALLAQTNVAELEGLADGMDSGEYVADPAPYHAELLRPAIKALHSLPDFLDEAAAFRARVIEARDAMARQNAPWAANLLTTLLGDQA